MLPYVKKAIVMQKYTMDVRMGTQHQVTIIMNVPEVIGLIREVVPKTKIKNILLGVLIIMVPLAFLFSTFKQDFLSFLASAGTLTLLNFVLANISVDSSVRKMVYAKVKALIKKV